LGTTAIPVCRAAAYPLTITRTPVIRIGYEINPEIMAKAEREFDVRLFYIRRSPTRTLDTALPVVQMWQD
jgi:hypothetical protein